MYRPWRLLASCSADRAGRCSCSVRMQALNEAATSIAVAHLATHAFSGAGRRDGTSLRTCISSASWYTRFSCIMLVAQATRVLFSRASSAMVHASLRLRLALLIIAHLGVMVLTCVRRIDSGAEWRLFRTALWRSACYIAPVYPLLVIGSSTILMVGTSSSVRITGLFTLERLHWLIDVGSLHAPLIYVHIHTKRYYARGSSPLNETDSLPMWASGEESSREQTRAKRLLRFSGFYNYI